VCHVTNLVEQPHRDAEAGQVTDLARMVSDGLGRNCVRIGCQPAVGYCDEDSAEAALAGRIGLAGYGALAAGQVADELSDQPRICAPWIDRPIRTDRGGTDIGR
jgi:hypothetical protein